MSNQYMVGVVGGGCPKVVHDSLASARKEAERLAAQPQNKQNHIYVFRVEDCLSPLSTHQWEKYRGT
jgi:hypothetical protein